MQYAAGHDKALCGRRSVRDANCVALREHERRFRELLPVEDTDTSGPVAMSLEQCADHSGRYDTRGTFEALLEGVAGVQAAVGRAERFEIHAINSPWAADEICAAEQSSEGSVVFHSDYSERLADTQKKQKDTKYMKRMWRST